ncbi:hypothetical protein [Micromonospora matsumotoense]|uniref:hypothetical protein n=1 Tax=Micromonospora matsumotoense TaxID=121616 RepID=UPI0033DE8C63
MGEKQGKPLSSLKHVKAASSLSSVLLMAGMTTHVAFYNENSFWYFTDAQYARFVPEIRCRFQVSRLATYFPSEFHRTHHIPYVVANLIAVKDGTRNGGLLKI